MDAVVTLKLTPQEFDLLRDAVRDAKDAAEKVSKERVIGHPKDRREASQKTIKLDDLLRKLS